MFSQLLTGIYGLLFLLFGGIGTISAFNSLRQMAFAPKYHPRRRGRIRATGLVRAADPCQTYLTPLSQTPCIAYRFTITKKTGKHASITLYQETQGRGNLYLQTEHGTLPITWCELQLKKIHYQDRHNLLKDFDDPKSHHLLMEKNIAIKNMAGIKRNITISEFILCNGDRAYLMGRQTWKNQHRALQNVLITDQPVSQLVVLASVMLIGSLLCMYIAIAMIQAVLR